MLCHFAQTRNRSAAIHYIIRGSTATSRATGNYAAVPERFGQIEEPAGSIDERTNKKPSFIPGSVNN